MIDYSIINDIKYNKYKDVIHLSYRAIDELEFKKLLVSENISNIDEKIIEKLSISMNIPMEDVILKIDMFIDKYYPGDNQVHNYVGVKNYELFPITWLNKKIPFSSKKKKKRDYYWFLKILLFLIFQWFYDIVLIRFQHAMS